MLRWARALLNAKVRSLLPATDRNEPNAGGAPRRTRAVSEIKIACSTNAALRRGSLAFGKGSDARGAACLGRNFESQSQELKVACSAVTFRAVGTERAVSSTNTALRRGEVPTPHLGAVKHASGRNLEVFNAEIEEYIPNAALSRHHPKVAVACQVQIKSNCSASFVAQ